MLDGASLKDRARGRWNWLLSQCGVDPKYLTGRHGPCPCCGGTDRFRYTNYNGDGKFICNQCGKGDGFDLLSRINGQQYSDVARRIENILGKAPIEIPKAHRSEEQTQARVGAIWRGADPLTGQDPASRYLKTRGIDIAALAPEIVAEMRFHPKLGYFHDDKGTRTDHPALLSRFCSVDGEMGMVARIYLSDYGDGLASVPNPKRMLGKVPPGGAVRLGPPAETMGIGEGLITCLSVHVLGQRFNRSVTVWSALTKGGVIKWKPPRECRHVIIFGDWDRNAEGQTAAWNAAHKLYSEGYQYEVRLPDPIDMAEDAKKIDFNDILQMELHD